MNKKILILLYLVLAAFAKIEAYDFKAAEDAYKNNNFEEAVALYTKGMEEEGVSAGLLYDLGNCYYKLGNEGDAMLCYERAKKLDPGNDMINQNLHFLTSKITDANKGSLEGKSGNVEPDQEGFMDSVYRLIAIDSKSDNWGAFAVMAFVLFLGGLALYMFTPNVLARKTGFFSALVFLGFTVIFIIFAFIAASQYSRKDQVILMEFTTQLMEKPDAGSQKVSSPLHKGTKLQVLDTKTGSDGSEWLKVKLNSDNIGWIKKDNAEVI